MNIHRQLIERRAILARATQTLKDEFIGLDSVIDNVMESIGPWFLFPNLQDRPVIVNLWGMTGVGKSSLVKRLTQLIGFSNRYYRFDIGEKSYSEWVVKKNLTEIYDRENGKPVILAFDEFQHARTKDDEGKEIDQVSSRIIWEILDNGKFQSSQVTRGISDIYELQQRLFGLLQRGVAVKNGVITHGQELFIREFQNDFSFFTDIHRVKAKKGEQLFFVNDQFLDTILFIMREEFDTQLDVRMQLKKFNGLQTIQFLKKVMELALAPKTID
ncbi:MAG: AAA family ATPase, partial [Bacteroidota bacterium]